MLGIEDFWITNGSKFLKPWLSMQVLATLHPCNNHSWFRLFCLLCRDNIFSASLQFSIHLSFAADYGLLLDCSFWCSTFINVS